MIFSFVLIDIAILAIVMQASTDAVLIIFALAALNAGICSKLSSKDDNSKGNNARLEIVKDKDGN